MYYFKTNVKIHWHHDTSIPNTLKCKTYYCVTEKSFKQNCALTPRTRVIICMISSWGLHIYFRRWDSQFRRRVVRLNTSTWGLKLSGHLYLVVTFIDGTLRVRIEGLWCTSTGFQVLVWEETKIIIIDTFVLSWSSFCGFVASCLM